MKKLQNFIHNNWLMLIIIFQPVLDIISYFQTEKLGNSFTWIIRIIFLGIIFLVTFINCKEKKKYILCLLPIVIYGLLHLINLMRVNQLFVVPEIKYFVFTFQTIAMAIMLIFYVKDKPMQKEKIKKGIVIASFIMIISIFLAYVTNTYQPTYVDASGYYGIIGWFSSANTASMVLCALLPFLFYYFFQKKNPYIYGIVTTVGFWFLYSNGTRSCYFTLVLVLLVLIYMAIFGKNVEKRYVKLFMTLILLVLAIAFYGKSFTSSRKSDVNDVNNEYKDVVDNIQKDPNISEPSQTEDVESSVIDFSNKKLLVKILNSSYIYENLIKLHGDDAVIKALREKFIISDLANNRVCKVVNARVHYDKSDFLTKMLGFGYGVIDQNSLDLENDLTAIFYYYGFIGFGIYISYLLYFLIRMIIYFFRNIMIIRDPEFVILGFMLVLLVGAGEYSGAFLRKSNANIYLSMYLVLIYFKSLKTSSKKKRITFLNLHLGVGGIESATINNANTLSSYYDVEIISVYKMKNDRSNMLNRNIHVRYLYNGEPNKEEFKLALHNKKVLKIIKEGFKAIYILCLKKVGIISAIQECDSKVIVSTRWDFSILLSRFKNKDTVAIAQEHHHHNHDEKYINVLKNKYKNIDYLFALTPGLENDYKTFLKDNYYTKIVCVPNMIIKDNEKRSSLKNKNLISVGRFHSGKKLDDMLDIFSKLDNKDVKLYLIGDGEEKEKLQKQINDLHLNDRVIMPGYLSATEQEKYYLDSVVFLMTSISEGLPMVLLEAMTYGVVLISYETESGVSDIIENEKNGYIIKDRNEEEFIEKINALLNDTNLLKKMSDYACISVNKYSKDEILKIWVDILNNIGMISNDI